MADVIQAQYEQLANIAARFGQQGEEAEALSAQVRHAIRPLQDGGWIGQGSDAFFAEMESLVLPGMQRLSQALEEARDITLQIKDILQQAEEEASSPFGGTASPGLAGPGVALPGGVGPAGDSPRTAAPGTGPSQPAGSDSGGSAEDWLAERPMIGFRLFGFAMGTKKIASLLGLMKTPSELSKVLGKTLPIVGGIIGTVHKIMGANARGENMDFAVGREITNGTLKTEVYLVPGLNVIAGGFELANMFGLTDTNYTDKAVSTIAEPVHKYALDPASDVLAEGMYKVDRGVRAGARGVKSVYNGAVDAFADGIDDVLPDWPF